MCPDALCKGVHRYGEESWGARDGRCGRRGDKRPVCARFRCLTIVARMPTTSGSDTPGPDSSGRVGAQSEFLVHPSARSVTWASSYTAVRTFGWVTRSAGSVVFGPAPTGSLVVTLRIRDRGVSRAIQRCEVPASMSGSGAGPSGRVTGTQQGRDTPRVSRPCGDRSGSARDDRDLDLRGDLRVEPDRDGVLADRLRSARHVDGPPGRAGTARGADGVDDLGRRDRAEEDGRRRPPPRPSPRG